MNRYTNRYTLFRAIRAARTAVAVAALAGLAACASTLSASVTSFQQWPGGAAGQTYTLTGPPDSENRLEYSAYQDMLRAAIGPTGLVEARDGQTARFSVSFRYASEAIQVVRREPVDPYFYGGLYGGRYWGWGGHYGWPIWVAVSQNAWRNTLTIDIRDAQRDNAEVYRSSAATLSSSPDALPRLMPYLMKAVFDDFPGNNGQVREVRYRRH